MRNPSCAILENESCTESQAKINFVKGFTKPDSLWYSESNATHTKKESLMRNSIDLILYRQPIVTLDHESVSLMKYFMSSLDLHFVTIRDRP